MSKKSVAIITGASRGIGAATARLLAANGFDVCINYAHTADVADALAGEINGADGGRAIAIKADVTDEADVARLFDETAEALGPVTALVNNAGITGPAGRVEDVTVETLRDVMELNVIGYFLAAREAVRRMSTKHGGPGGAIVNVSSAAAWLGGGGEFVPYSASKGATDTLTIGLAAEVVGEGIRVNSVNPGVINTTMHAAAGVPDRPKLLGPKIPMGRIGEPEEVAEAVLWLLSDASRYTTGAKIPVSGGR